MGLRVTTTAQCFYSYQLTLLNAGTRGGTTDFVWTSTNTTFDHSASATLKFDWKQCLLRAPISARPATSMVGYVLHHSLT